MNNIAWEVSQWGKYGILSVYKRRPLPWFGIPKRTSELKDWLNWLDLLECLEMMLYLFYIKSNSLSHFISCILFHNDYVVFSVRHHTWYIPHITHKCILWRESFPQIIIGCCRIAVKNGFILSYTRKIVELKRNQPNLVDFFPLFL